MGFWKEFFSNMDEPAIIIRSERTIEIPDEELSPYRKEIKQIKELMNENKELKKRLRAKRINAIDTDYKLLE